MTPTDYERETALLVYAAATCQSLDRVRSCDSNPATDTHRRIDAIAALLASRREGWVDVREGLPVEGVTVQVWCVPADSPRMSPDHEKAYLANGMWYEYTSDDLLYVTHWMPLPPTPPEVKP
jgi:hypothetical protein